MTTEDEVTHLVDWIFPLLRDRSIEVQGLVLGRLFAKVLVDHTSTRERTQILVAYAAALQVHAFGDKVRQ